MGFQWSFEFDIRFANSWLAGRKCQIHSTGDEAAPGRKAVMEIGYCCHISSAMSATVASRELN